jgi:hypothetical protein
LHAVSSANQAEKHSVNRLHLCGSEIEDSNTHGAAEQKNGINNRTIALSPKSIFVQQDGPKLCTVYHKGI